MDELQNKLRVLSKIAKKLNENNITWAIGGSLLLYFKGIVNEFHDIDIVVAESDIEQSKEILLSFGMLLPSVPSSKYKTRSFLEFRVEGVDIDIMAGFSIVNNGHECYFPLKPSDINDYIEIDNTNIPLQSVEQWRIYYDLMGRSDKVDLIDRKRK